MSGRKRPRKSAPPRKGASNKRNAHKRPRKSGPQGKGASKLSGPPKLNDKIKIPQDSDLPRKSAPLSSVNDEVDFVLLTVKDCEFKACYSYLQNPLRYYRKSLGYLYIGKMGEEDEDEKLRVALMKCDMGSGVGGSAIAVKNAVTALRPKGVFCVGYCGGMNAKKAKLGDVAVSSKLIAYEPGKVTKDGIQHRGTIVPLNKNLNDIVRHAAYGWKAPVKNSKEAGEVVNGWMLSGAKVLNDKKERKRLLDQYPEAIAIEMEGEGVYTAAHDLKIEWVVVKGISDYADGTKADTKNWRPYASVMAASVVAHILSNSFIFKDWPHCGGEPAETSAVAPKRRRAKRPHTESSSGSVSKQGDKGTPAKTSAVPSKRARTEPSSSSVQGDKVKDGQVSDRDMQKLADDLGGDWEKLGRRLGVKEPILEGCRLITQLYPALSDKANAMLINWRKKEGKSAKYKALYDALCDKPVQRRDLAEEICCE